MIVGTAGHIDHGKTTLVRALTGVDTDRLKEEKARGLTIELGYAYAPLQDDDVLAFIDVPGHERLVHTMAAGASGIDFGLLVIAADDGVMPQTREHLAILSLLGIRDGAIALTKSDRADEARRQALRSEIAELVHGSFLADAPVFELNAAAWLANGQDTPPDAADPSGVRALKTYLTDRALAASQARHPAAGHDPTTEEPFRLAIDRVFTLKGHGTVVTGTVHGGALRLGDETADIRLMPAGKPVRVRSLHAQNRPAEIAFSGQRCALNLAGVDKDAMSRGDWIADARCFTPSRHVDVWLRLLAHDDEPMRTWSPVHVQLGAAHCIAHAVPLSHERLPYGEAGMAQLVFDHPVCAMPGDRFIVRSAQADRTIGGGLVLDPGAPDRKRRSPQRLAWLNAVHTLRTGGGLQALFDQAVQGLDDTAILRLTGRCSRDLPTDVMQVPLPGGHGTLAIKACHWEALAVRACTALEDFHLRQPDEPGVDDARLRRMALPNLSPWAWQALRDALLAEGRLRRRGAWLSLPTHDADLTPDETALASVLIARVEAGAFDPPWVRDHAREIDAAEEDVRKLMRKLLRRGELIQVVKDLFYHPERISSLATMIHSTAQAQGITAADFRDLTGLGRKRAIQILEFFDRVGYTRRLRDAHVLRKDGTSPWQQVS